MKVLCAWCGAVIQRGDGATVSHGICPTCAARLREQRDAEQRTRNEESGTMRD